MEKLYLFLLFHFDRISTI